MFLFGLCFFSSLYCIMRMCTTFGERFIARIELACGCISGMTSACVWWHLLQASGGRWMWIMSDWRVSGVHVAVSVRMWLAVTVSPVSSAHWGWSVGPSVEPVCWGNAHPAH